MGLGVGVGVCKIDKNRPHLVGSQLAQLGSWKIMEDLTFDVISILNSSIVIYAILLSQSSTKFSPILIYLITFVFSIEVDPNVGLFFVWNNRKPT